MDAPGARLDQPQDRDFFQLKYGRRQPRSSDFVILAGWSTTPVGFHRPVALPLRFSREWVGVRRKEIPA